MIMALCGAIFSTCLAAVSSTVSASVASASTSTSSKTTWLCSPALPTDPCRGGINLAIDPVVGAPMVRTITAAKNPPIDCFYAYPTVSGQPGANADLTVEASQQAIATMQAAPFSQVCRVFSPMYHQVTLAGLQGLSRPQAKKALETSYASLAQGFRSFLAQEPKGRHFVVIGHSQGAAMLIRLLKNVIDPNPALRSRLVSALLIGGNLTVAKGKTTGGAFRHIPLCTSGKQLGCAMAYSAFSESEPPSTSSFFGIPGQGVSLMWGQTSKSKSLEVACTNPARFGPGSLRLNARFPSGSIPGAEYVTYPSLYRGRCTTFHGARYLEVTTVTDANHPASIQPNVRPVVQGNGAQWGLHAYDVNLGLGDLVALVARESLFLRTHR